MIIDTSALIAILRNEPEAPHFAKIIAAHYETRRLSAANYLEAAIVIDSERDPVISRRLDEFIQKAEIEIEAITVDQARIARQAYRDYGKGSGHQAGLNFGDCFAYALAQNKNEAVLFKGNDFNHTDIKTIS